MMNTDVSLKIIWTWIFVFPIRAKRADVAWGIMNQAMSYHFILSFEALAPFTSWTPFDWTIVWPYR